MSEIPDAVRTGNTAVDEALDDLLDQMEHLTDRPVAEHVAVFEQAHTTLRRALDAGGEQA